MVPVVVLAIIAIVLIRSLMSVVARDEAAGAMPWSPDYTSVTDPTVELRATANDDVRGFLLPATPEALESDAPPAWIESVTDTAR
jgi:hypothetical protein